MKIKAKKIVIAISLLISLFTLLLFFSSLKEVQLKGFFSSDALYLPSIYIDLFENDGTFCGWVFNPAPNFFPDFLVYSILMFFSNSNFVVASFLFSIIQYFGLIFLFYLILRKVLPSYNRILFAISIYSFLLFLFTYFVDNDFYFSFLMVVNSYHTGSFILALGAFLVFLSYFESFKSKYLILLLCSIPIAFFCDNLFLFYFIVPAILVVICHYFFIDNKKYLNKLLLCLAFSVVLSIIFNNLMRHNLGLSFTNTYTSIKWGSIMNGWDIFCEQITNYLKDLKIKALIIILSTISYLWTVYTTILLIKKKKKEKFSKSAFFVLQLFVTFFVPIVLFAPIFSGAYRGYDTIRYNYFVFILALFYLPVLANYHFPAFTKLYATLYGAFSSILIIFLFASIANDNPVQGLKHFFTFYPEQAQQMDKIAKKNGLVYGITDDYWSAKYITMFSKEGIRLYPVFNHADAYLHVINKYWFFGGGKGKYENPEFVFIYWSDGKPLPPFLENQEISIETTEIVSPFSSSTRMDLIYTPPFHFDHSTKYPFFDK